MGFNDFVTSAVASAATGWNEVFPVGLGSRPSHLGPAPFHGALNNASQQREGSTFRTSAPSTFFTARLSSLTP